MSTFTINSVPVIKGEVQYHRTTQGRAKIYVRAEMDGTTPEGKQFGVINASVSVEVDDMGLRLSGSGRIVGAQWHAPYGVLAIEVRVLP